MPSVKDLIEGYGPKFPKLDELLDIEADEADELRLKAPIPALDRYLKSVKFLQDVTSGKAVGFLRFKTSIEYFIALTDLMGEYKGQYQHQKVADKISDEDKARIRQLGRSTSEILRAEKLEEFAEHDTAAATDYLKISIGTQLPHLEHMIEGVHFALTSEDPMSITFGQILNKLVYGHFMPHLLDYCDNLVAYSQKYEEKAPLVLPGFTHEQAAEPTTLGKKVAFTVFAINELIENMLDKNDNFKPFSAKLSGAISNFTTHYAAYPDIDWKSFAKKFVEGVGLHYEKVAHQAVSYVREATHFMNIANILTQIMKFTDDFIKMSSCPGQLFVKEQKKGAKSSSIMPNKSNAWGMEGGLKMLAEAQDGLIMLAKELPKYPHEGNMGRSYLCRNVGDKFMPIFIALGRISSEMNRYQPNNAKINAFFNEYPGMAGSVAQTILKRAKIEGDAYRVIQSIAINPDGTYANAIQFKDGLDRKMRELNLDAGLSQEIRDKLDLKSLIEPADKLVKETFSEIKNTFAGYRQKLAKYQQPLFEEVKK